MSGLDGHLRLRAAPSGGRTALVEQAARSPFHVGKPYWHDEARTLMVQVVNATAGVLAGDRLESEITVDAGASLLVTTPSATRVFRMGVGEAACRQTFSVAAGGFLEVLPEPLVPHRGCRYRQQTGIDLSPGGALFYADLLVPGRTGHGEAWAWERLSLETEVRLDGDRVLRERFDQNGAALRSLADWAGSGPEACFGNALVLAPDSSVGARPFDVAQGRGLAERLDRADPASLPERAGELRPYSAQSPLAKALADVAALHGNGIWVGVSPLRRGGWSIKFVAPDSLRLRDTLRAIRRALSAALPPLAADPRKL